MSKIKVMIVDDAIVMRRLISGVLEKDADLEILSTAANGKIAVEKVLRLNPDIVTMDVEMPEMNGIEATRELRKRGFKGPIIIFSTLTTKGARSTLDALHAGASDYVAKPANVGHAMESLQVLEKELVPKVKALCRHLLPLKPFAGIQKRATTEQSASRRFTQRPNLLCIGSSTGGPNALDTIFEAIPAHLPVPVLLVQHMPPLFTQHFTERLEKRFRLHFIEAEEGMSLKAGAVYVAPGGKHMEVGGSLTPKIHLTDDPPVHYCRPAVDVMLNSVSNLPALHPLTVILTGMGCDGLAGCERLFHAGHPVIAQDEASSVVWGMPGHVVESGLADKVLPIDKIADAILCAFPLSTLRYGIK